MKQNQYISILNKINSKPLIMEFIFPFILKRPCILDNLISKDIILKNKLNQIFSNVKKKSNKLGKEFCNNLENYILIRDINKKLNEWYQTIKNKHIVYKYLKNELNFSFLSYLNEKIKKYIYLYFINYDILKGIIKEYYSSLDYAVITYLPNNYKYLDYEYLQYIIESNKKSSEKNRIKQKIKLILIIDENQFYYSDNNIIKYKNINELEIIFNYDNISKDNLFYYFNIYLSKIEYLENIYKIIFHNKSFENNLTDNNNTKINKELYQSLLSFLFDDFYREQNEDIKNQIKLMKNIKEIIIDISFLYIYEKIKLYYCINEIFPSLTNNKFDYNSEIDLPFYINNKIMIINNKEKTLKINQIISLIGYHLNKNKNNIEYLMIINHKNLIKDENINNNININISNLKEFSYIVEESDSDNNIKEFINILTLSNNNKQKYNKYEGYNKNNKLIFYREGETQIQSFDLIDLFKYNKKLTNIKLINEKIIINYNEERTNLEIINIETNKSEITKIIKDYNYLELSHFCQFIYNQNSLKELTITNFDINFNDIINNNIDILNLNFIKDNSILKYIIKNVDNSKLNDYFPKLIIFNIGGNCDNIFNLLHKCLSDKLKKINIITRKIKTKYFSKIIKKLNLYKIETIINDLQENKKDNLKEEKENKIAKDKNSFNDYYEDEEEDENEDNEEYYEEEEEYGDLDDIINFQKFNNTKKKK